MLKTALGTVFRRAMSSITEQLAHPAVNREMRELDRAFFDKRFPIWSLFLKDAGQIRYFVQECKEDLLQIPGLHFIVRAGRDLGSPENPQSKLLLLTERLTREEDAESVLAPLTLKYITQFGAELRPYELVVGYDFWRADQILKAVLPTGFDEEVPSGFTRTGHIAHLNLKAEYKPYDRLIGQVILDKNKSVSTVVDKVESIATEFRTFPMKVIAGEDNFIVTQAESDCQFRFDFSKVYWNSRLHTEHKRLVDSFQQDEAVCDLMAGVGPFVIPAAKRQLVVFANDLNPDSYKWLNTNVQLNKVGNFLKTFNEDARKFVKKSPKLIWDFSNDEQFVEIKSSLRKKKKTESNKDQPLRKPIPKFFSHYIMNLPDSAVNFLDSFIGLYSGAGFTREQVREIPGFKLPIINFHHFEKFDHTESPTDEELHHRVHEKIKRLIGFDIAFEEVKFHLVRKVSPTKPMYCVSFRLPEEVAFAEV